MMKPTPWIVIAAPIVLFSMILVALATSVYVDADDPAAVKAAEDAVRARASSLREVSIVTPQAIPMKSKVVKLVGLKAVEVEAEPVKLDKSWEDLGAKKVGEKIQLSLSGDVLFDFDKWKIRKQGVETLARLSKAIKTLAVKKVLIEGHTDSKGSAKYNLILSIRRAKAVKAWLVKKGDIPEKVIVTKGYGESKPVAPNTNPDGSDNPKGRAKNRRVEIVITSVH